MFTGIIKETGKITNIQKTSKGKAFSVQTNKLLKNKKIGNSIAVDGICVTITNIHKKQFTFDAMPETLSASNMNNLKKGDFVNLEPALTLNQALDGHLVQGHVDTVGIVENLKKEKQSVKLTINFPKDIECFLAFKGSITINGVSLTISDLQTTNFTVDLIPHTLKITNLETLKKHDKVNLEVDIIARYLHRQLCSKEKETKFEYLKQRGFI